VGEARTKSQAVVNPNGRIHRALQNSTSTLVASTRSEHISPAIPVPQSPSLLSSMHKNNLYSNLSTATTTVDESVSVGTMTDFSPIKMRGNNQAVGSSRSGEKDSLFQSTNRLNLSIHDDSAAAALKYGGNSISPVSSATPSSRLRNRAGA